ncbi:SIS domain-containing protein [Staphylococcus intermedius]|uniref:Tagatose-6-phosphate ketose/aldose isomerase n=1 Tax=Staphylococcus intermedius NCTC 11048 TaxID=1141106 RepID=A0A380G5C9_STAIN|nr:SIS domain-containing protein [Staphylococcus intermedius]PCF64137.1 tagatose-6-phosphate ketose isomerase [Staphylococcus intermedius]PCF78852.1 tagatose-6-phosphate ketose isomerase [Staphylococcus intermedius]PCF79825.1 tagatose-6-phosphate ketose isomerase [Staphylococcus intermedius]PCF84994.1 tagatose-6-phosphate ketose isomerase [Staphylococcus intermedius]PCF89516.1 tagatose-6-phosphate ketose isomerase [Staphylococcus intermedius]
MLYETDTYREIKQQPQTLKKTFDIVRAQQEAFDQFVNRIEQENVGKKLKVLFTGAGSSAYVGDVARMARNTAVMPNFEFESVPTTHFVTDPQLYIDDQTAYLVVSFARSGNSPETKATVEFANELSQNVYHLFITNNKDGFLGAYEADKDNVFKVILPEETNDKSLAMTSSFSSMLFASYLLFGGTVSPQFFEIAASNFDWLEQQAQAVNALEFSKVFYVGTGLIGELTKEVSLKLNELTAGQTEIARETTLGFRHGPKAGLSKDTIFIMMRSNGAYHRQYEDDLIKEVGQVKDRYKMYILDGQSDAGEHTVQLPQSESLSDMELALQYLMFGQLLAAQRSDALGLNPDNPSPDGFINRVVKGVTIYPVKG